MGIQLAVEQTDLLLLILPKGFGQLQDKAGNPLIQAVVGSVQQADLILPAHRQLHVDLLQVIHLIHHHNELPDRIHNESVHQGHAQHGKADNQAEDQRQKQEKHICLPLHLTPWHHMDKPPAAVSRLLANVIMVSVFLKLSPVSRQLLLPPFPLRILRQLLLPPFPLRILRQQCKHWLCVPIAPQEMVAAV